MIDIDPFALILVAVLNDPRDLEIARLLGWYRIPMRSAPKVVAVDWLAFYQTSAFIDARWQIKFLAQVRGVELATRKELLKEEPNHPHANHEYYKIQISALQTLDPPLKAGKWRRITFLYTTGEALMNANSINDLVIREDERRVLWRALCERAAQGSYRNQDELEIDLDDSILNVILGIGYSIKKPPVG